MKHNITPALVAAFTTRITAMGYTVAAVREEQPLFAVSRQGAEICKFEPNGDMRYYPDNPLAEHRHEIYSLMCEMKGAHDLYMEAKSLPGGGASGYRLISACGDILLAGKLETDNEIHFTTWKYSNDGTALTMGHYYQTDYVGAAQDFALRAGLVDENKLFTQRELMTLYTACVYYAHGDELSRQEEEQIQGLTQKLKDSLVCSVTPAQELEQEAVNPEFER